MKPYECEICDYSAFQKNTLSSHTSSVHEQKKPFKCGACDYSSILKKSLNDHISFVNQQKNPSNVKFVTRIFQKNIY